MIRSRAHPLVRAARELLAARARRERGEFLAEGIALVGDALAAGACPRYAFVVPQVLDRSAAGRELLRQLDAWTPTELSTAAFDAIADTETPQGVAAVFPIQLARLADAEPGLIVVADGLQDPGNLGTLIRSSVGSGVVSIVAVRGGADPFGPKVVRAAAGALFRQAIARPSDVELAQALAGREVWLAERGAGTRYDRVDWRAAGAVAIGSEAHGPSPELRRLATGAVSIPLAPGLDSLNAGVAASIILFEAARQLNR